jgi:multiple sugar transport system permease protein
MRGRSNRRDAQWWLFLLPSAIMLGCVMLYPLGYAIYLSFFNDDLGTGAHAFIGAANYTSLLADGRFWTSLSQTALIAASAVALEFSIGLVAAYGLYWLTFGARTFNLLLFLPYVVTPVVAGLFLRWIFVGRWGLLSSILIGVGVFPPDWLGTPGWARLAVILADGWQFTPFIILVLYAGLNTIDQS